MNYNNIRSIPSSSDDDDDLDLESNMGFEGAYSPTRSRVRDNEAFNTNTSKIINEGKFK